MKARNRIFLISLIVLSYLMISVSIGVITLVYRQTGKIDNVTAPPPETGNRPAPRIRFEENRGQVQGEADFFCRGKNHIHFITHDGSVLKLTGDDSQLRDAILRLRLIDCNPDNRGRGLERLTSRSHYFKGGPDAWLTDIPHFARVKYERIYDGIDLVYYIQQDHVEFDFLIGPASDPSRIAWTYEGADRLEFGENGDLIVFAGGHQLVFKKPVAWQERDAKKVIVETAFTVAQDQSVSFEIQDYDRERALTIDPELVYSTYLGGGESDLGDAIAVGNDGCAVIGGKTLSADFPTFNPFQSSLTEGMFSYLSDAFVAKFNPQGNDILFSTYIGGNWDDEVTGIGLDASGNVYITGRTASRDDPDTPEYEGFPLQSAYQTESNGDEEAFVTVLNSTGSTLIYSTYWGGDGEDRATDIAVGIDGNCSITGVNFSYGIPIKNAVQPNKPSYYYDPFAARFDPSLSGENSLIWSTYLGGYGDDYGYGVAVDDQGNTYVTGMAKSEFPVTGGVIQTEYKGSGDAFVAKIPPEGLTLAWATYLGSDGSDEGKDIEIGPDGSVYVCGAGRDGFPTTPGAFQESGGYHFLSKMNPDGSGFQYSTHVPASGRIAVDDTGQVYIAYNRAKQNDQGQWISNANVLAVNAEGSDTLYTMIFGGSASDGIGDIAVDSDRSLYITGNTQSSDLPVENAFQASLGGKNDVFVAKFGKPIEDFVVEVWQDPVGHAAVKIPETEFNIYFIDLNAPEDPFVYLETRTTDANGFMYLPASLYQPGWPILLWKIVESKAAVKSGHEAVNNIGYDVYVDNLHLDETGEIHPTYLVSDIHDTTVTYVEHTWIGFNLLISIEWPASDDYVDRLKIALANASRFLYDVTNGHACLQDVAIYDNGEYWNKTDIRILANNQQTPLGAAGGIDMPYWQIYLPPKHFGGRFNNALDIYNTPIKVETYTNYATLVHELGHYLFGFKDEYQDEAGNLLDDEVNFGVMDDQYRSSNAFSSELSAFESDAYKKTQQYVQNHATCWDQFHDKFSRMYGAIRAEIHTPAALGLTEGQYVAGPSEDDLGVNAVLNIIDETGPDGGERIEYHVKNAAGESMPGVFVKVTKDDREIKQGKTVPAFDHKGKIRLFGAEPGDVLHFSHTGKYDEYQFLEMLNQSAGKHPLYPNTASTTTSTVILNKLQGIFSMLPKVYFNPTGGLLYGTTAEPAFSADPTLKISYDNTVHDASGPTSSNGVYTFELPDISGAEADLLFRAPDSSGAIFFVPHVLNIVDIDATVRHIAPPGNELEMWPDSISADLEKLAILSSIFPPPRTGLIDSVSRVSPVFSIQSYPSTALLQAVVRIHYSGDTHSPSEPGAVQMYTWDEEWLPMTTSVDTARNQATSRLEKPGLYAAFMDLTKSYVTGIQNHDERTHPQTFTLYPNTPNPFNPATVISFDLPEMKQVKLEVFDLRGRRITILADGILPAGHHKLTWDGSGHTSGVYICRLTTDTVMKSRKMMLMK